MSAGRQNYTQLQRTNKASYVSWIWDSGYNWVKHNSCFTLGPLQLLNELNFLLLTVCVFFNAFFLISFVVFWFACCSCCLFFFCLFVLGGLFALFFGTCILTNQLSLILQLKPGFTSPPLSDTNLHCQLTNPVLKPSSLNNTLTAELVLILSILVWFQSVKGGRRKQKLHFCLHLF